VLDFAIKMHYVPDKKKKEKKEDKQHMNKKLAQNVSHHEKLREV
jgi:hypothetical protein